MKYEIHNKQCVAVILIFSAEDGANGPPLADDPFTSSWTNLVLISRQVGGEDSAPLAPAGWGEDSAPCWQRVPLSVALGPDPVASWERWHGSILFISIKWGELLPDLRWHPS